MRAPIIQVAATIGLLVLPAISVHAKGVSVGARASFSAVRPSSTFRAPSVPAPRPPAVTAPARPPVAASTPSSSGSSSSTPSSSSSSSSSWLWGLFGYWIGSTASSSDPEKKQ